MMAMKVDGKQTLKVGTLKCMEEMLFSSWQKKGKTEKEAVEQLM